MTIGARATIGNDDRRRMQSSISSPVTGSHNVERLTSIATKDVMKSYDAIGVSNISRYLGKIDTIDIFKCNDTGYRFYYPFTVLGDDRFYEYLQEKRKYYSDWRWEHGIALDEITKSTKLLEIGCGDGNFLIRASTVASESLGLEFNGKAIELAKRRGLNVIEDTIQAHAEKKPEYYDVVCYFQVLEHIADVRSFILSSVKALRVGGRLILGVPNNNPYLFKHDKLHALNLPPHHAGLWDKKSLRNIQEVFGLKLEKIAVEPLFDADLYWKIQKAYWKNASPLIYALSKLVPDKLSTVRNAILKKICDGRNIIAIYSKEM